MSSTDPGPQMQAPKPRNTAATLALFGIAYFLAADVTVYFLNPGYEIIRASPGDQYDVKSFGLLVASALWALGLGSLALAIGLHQGVSRPRRSRMGLLLLGMWGIGMLIAGVFPASGAGSTVAHITTVRLAGIFPVEVQANPDTAFGWIHILAMLWSFVMLSIASVLLSRRSTQDEEWNAVHHLELILALVMCITLTLFVATLLFPPLLKYPNSGPVTFMLIGLAIGVMWLLLLAIRLRFAADKPVSN